MGLERCGLLLSQPCGLKSLEHLAMFEDTTVGTEIPASFHHDADAVLAIIYP